MYEQASKIPLSSHKHDLPRKTPIQPPGALRSFGRVSALFPASIFSMKLSRGLWRALERSYSSDAAAPTLGGRPYRVAVCGAGPSGFYATSRLLSLPGSERTRVDLFEQLPVPFGLSRYGVAPDHPEVKVRLCRLTGQEVC